MTKSDEELLAYAKKQQAWYRNYNKATQRAYRALKDKHPEEFAELLAAKREEIDREDDTDTRPG